jgi:serine/threonine-protein kinase
LSRPDDQIFSDALDLPPAERAAFLARECADPAQRARVEALLASEASANDFLAASAIVRPAELPEEKPGDVIDRYTLQRRLGEGGCGVVWLAEQTTPLRRSVALKVIKLGMDTREVIARFEAERQTLALMDHPGIARVYDAGSTAGGRPYFVMEYVDGAPITRFCDERKMSTAERLALFSSVCHALQHAHQKGVIHRDVKPSNILVAFADGKPVPKIIDFGIAKATQGRLAPTAQFTQLGQLLGTPAYMSPEQVDAREHDIDTRSDIYALGVVLYELLAGRPPYDPSSLVEAGLLEVRRIIREVDPPRPSTRLSTLTDVDRATVASLRSAAPPQLSSVLRGDLDWIVMRCLEKDRRRRYATAHELAADVERHLRREAVHARPPDALYRARKFVSRHRLACASAAAISVALIGGATISLLQAQRARAAEAVARTERDAARAAAAAEAVAKADAQRRQEQAEELFAFMLGDFRTELKKLGKLDLLDAVGAKALAQFNALDPRDLTTGALLRQVKTLTQIGEIRLDQTRFADAGAAFDTAYQRARFVTDREPQNADALFERGQTEYWLGFTARRRGEPALAREWLVRYRDTALALAQLEPTTPRSRMELVHGHHNLAVLDLDAARTKDAEISFRALRAALREFVAAAPNDSALAGRLADTSSWLGSLAELDARYAEAREHFAAMTAAYEALAAREPKVARWKLGRAESLAFTAALDANTGNTAAALAGLDRAQPLLAELRALDPANKSWLLAELRLQLQRAGYLAAGSTPEVAALTRATLARVEELARAEPASQVLQRMLVTAARLHALTSGATPEGQAALTRATDAGAALLQAGRADARARWDYASALLLAADRAVDSADQQALATRALDAVSPGWTKSRDWRLIDPAARALRRLGRTAEADAALEPLRAAGYAPADRATP